MLIVGIDPGLVNTGWAIVDFDKNNKSQLIAYGLIKTKSNQNIAIRLSEIFNNLLNSLSIYNIEYGALERTLVNKNASSSMDLSMARSVALLYFGLNKINYSEYLPTFIKKSITGNGNADKDMIKNMIFHYFSQDEREKFNDLSHHEIDAAAIALCHGFYLLNNS